MNIWFQETYIPFFAQKEAMLKNKNAYAFLYSVDAMRWGSKSDSFIIPFL